ncbi:hypothetical protein DLREEDagr8_10880 [Dongia sp. agr-C8]
MWTYPWDVIDLGLEAVSRDLQDRAGLNGINIAAAYHAGRFFQPRSPKRKAYFPEDGTIYFQPDPQLWAGQRILPKVADVVAGQDVLRDLIAARDRGGLSVACWTVCLHNMRLGLLHPDRCTRNAFGDTNYYSLCPSHPDVRSYVITLIKDLTTRYRPDIVQLETPGFMGYAHEFHHEKDGVGLTAEDDFLMSLCFCDACIAGAAKSGVDAGAAHKTVQRWIVEASERAVPAPRWPDFVTRGPDVFRDQPELEAFVRWRFEPVTSLIAAIRDEADPRVPIDVIDINDGWRSGSDLAALGKISEGVVFCAYDRSPEALEADTAKVRALLGGDVKLGVGMRLFHPEMRSAEDIAARSLAAIRAGAGEIDYYNYGLVPAARLDWVRAASDAVMRHG